MLNTLKRQNAFFPVFADAFFRENFLNDSEWSKSPAVNIAENGEGFRIELAVPGIGKEDITIRVEKRMLEIASEKEYKKDAETEKQLRKEFSFSGFRKSFSLPEYVDADNIKASCSNGILNVWIPKLDQVKDKPTRTIEIG